MCLGLGEEAVLQTAKTLPNRKTLWTRCWRPGSAFRNGEAQSSYSKMNMQENEVFCYKFLSWVQHCVWIFLHLNIRLVTIRLWLYWAHLIHVSVIILCLITVVHSGLVYTYKLFYLVVSTFCCTQGCTGWDHLETELVRVHFARHRSVQWLIRYFTTIKQREDISFL